MRRSSGARNRRACSSRFAGPEGALVYEQPLTQEAVGAAAVAPEKVHRVIAYRPLSKFGVALLRDPAHHIVGGIANPFELRVVVGVVNRDVAVQHSVARRLAPLHQVQGHAAGVRRPADHFEGFGFSVPSPEVRAEVSARPHHQRERRDARQRRSQGRGAARVKAPDHAVDARGDRDQQQGQRRVNVTILFVGHYRVPQDERRRHRDQQQHRPGLAHSLDAEPDEQYQRARPHAREPGNHEMPRLVHETPESGGVFDNVDLDDADDRRVGVRQGQEVHEPRERHARNRTQRRVQDPPPAVDAQHGEPENGNDRRQLDAQAEPEAQQKSAEYEPGRAQPREVREGDIRTEQYDVPRHHFGMRLRPEVDQFEPDRRQERADQRRARAGEAPQYAPRAADRRQREQAQRETRRQQVRARPGTFGRAEDAGQHPRQDVGADAFVELPGNDAVAKREAVRLLQYLVDFVGELKTREDDRLRHPQRHRQRADRRQGPFRLQYPRHVRVAAFGHTDRCRANIPEESQGGTKYGYGHLPRGRSRHGLRQYNNIALVFRS